MANAVYEMHFSRDAHFEFVEFKLSCSKWIVNCHWFMGSLSVFAI